MYSFIPQDALQRNSNPSSFGGRNQNFRLTQGERLTGQTGRFFIFLFLGFLLSSTQQVLDRWSAQVQDTVHAVEKDNKSVESIFHIWSKVLIRHFIFQQVTANAIEQKMTDFIWEFWKFFAMKTILTISSQINHLLNQKMGQLGIGKVLVISMFVLN